MQKIKIKNFGPIKDLELNIKDFMLFIGPQASGKSTIAKTIFFFKSLKEDFIINYARLVRDGDTEDFSTIVKLKFFDIFGDSILQNSFELSFYYDDNESVFIKIKGNEKDFNLDFSDKLQDFFIDETNKLSELKNQTSPLTSDDWSEIKEVERQFIYNFKKKCSEILCDDRDSIFVPAGRSFYSALSDSVAYLNFKPSDFLIQSFTKKVFTLKSMFNNPMEKIIQLRKSKGYDVDSEKAEYTAFLIRKILKGEYKNDISGEKIYLEDGKYVNLNFASSGQQESLWILLLLFIIILEQQNVFVVIEEPEAHLFPEAQKDIVALIALLSNMKQSQVIITTHSPYILASVNNLIMADKVGKKHFDKVSKRINKYSWLEREKVYAAFVQDGKEKEIIDKEFDIIDQKYIDSVSRIINDEFDFLYELEEGENYE